MPVLDELADKVTNVVLHGARDEPIAFDTWLETWRQTFTHWDDPVRQMVSHFARYGDAAEFIKTFHLVDGLVLLDWLLATHEGWCDRAVMLHALRTATYPSPQPPILPDAHASMAAVRPRKMRSSGTFEKPTNGSGTGSTGKPSRLRRRSNCGLTSIAFTRDLAA